MLVFTQSSMGELGDTAKNDYLNPVINVLGAVAPGRYAHAF